MAKRIIKKRNSITSPPMPTVEEWLQALGAASLETFSVTGYTGAELCDLLGLAHSTICQKLRVMYRKGLVGCAPRARVSVGIDGVARKVPVYYLKAK